MERVALCGGIASGKSTIRKALGKQGYQEIVFTDLLKSYAADALSAVSEQPITIEDINNNKEEYRLFLQSLGALMGFDWDTSFVEDTLFNWKRGTPVVFDNVRTLKQWKVLERYGFTLVYIQTSRHQRVRRSGLSALEYTQAEAHPIENNQELYNLASLVVDGTAAVEENVEKIKAFRVEKVSEGV